MITTLIICVTVVLIICIILKWITDMSRAELPMFTYGECVQKETEEYTPHKDPIGFTPPEEDKPAEKKSDKEIKDAIMTDPITMAAALLRGEVDIDELTI